MPFDLAVRECAEFTLHPVEHAGYEVVFYPPTRVSDVPQVSQFDEVTIDDGPAFLANPLWIDFHRSSFNRRLGDPVDPPIDVIQSVLEKFFERLRYVACASFLTTAGFPEQVSWQLTYLSDDGGELQAEEGLSQGRGAV